MAKKKNFLDKKITVGASIGDAIVVIGISLLAMWCFNTLTTKNYKYEDMNGNLGNSNICYKTKEGLYCRADIKVEWYGEV